MKANYGIDSLSLVWSLFIGFIISLALALFFYFFLHEMHPAAALGLFWLALIAAIVLLGEAGFMIWSSLHGKTKVMPQLIESLSLTGEESVLDIGCGTGQLSTLIGKVLPQGNVIGIDQRCVSKATANIEIEGAENVKAEVQDFRKLPYPDESFDAAVSSLALHLLPERMDRERVLIEINRILKPGGRLAILDCSRINEYAETLTHLQWNDVTISERYMYMFPFVRILTATKPNVIIE